MIASTHKEKKEEKNRKNLYTINSLRYSRDIKKVQTLNAPQVVLRKTKF